MGKTRTKPPWARAAAAALLALPLFALPPTGDETRQQLTIEPIEIDMTEHTERSLLLLDVEAVDKQGQPMTGLQQDDFRIRVNYLWRKIYSVDDLCACGDAAPDPDTPPTPLEAARLALIRAPPHYILYFDYSQLGARGRDQARDEARRWVREIMKSEDRVMVAAYATNGGLRTFSEFTSDPVAVVEAIERSHAAPKMHDPFPTQLGRRTQMCVDGTLNCSHTGRQEYLHARRSMETLRNFLTDLDEIPERKTLVLFHENASIFPGRMYGGAPAGSASIQDEIRGYETPYFERAARMRNASGWVPDLLELEEQLGGSATASRTAVYPILCGSARVWNVNLGANLADQTGGDYNRSIEKLQEVLDAAGRRCPCFYRIGLEMRDVDDSFVLRTKIRVKDQVLPSRYRVEYLTDGDRWMRKAQLVMANPDAWNELGVRAALVPVGASRKSWDLSVQVAVDISGMEPSPTGEHDGEWEVAALLGTRDFRKTWEMLGVYRVRPGDERRPSTVVLHERLFEGLRPGRYELRSFARDRETNRFGAARHTIELPLPAKGGLTSSVPLRPEAWHFQNGLPMKKDKRPPASQTRPRRLGRLPFGEPQELAAGEPLQFLAWYCGADAPAVRAVVRGESGSERVQTLTPGDRLGPCAGLSSTLDSQDLAAGSYVYELTPANGPPVSTPFNIR